MAEWNGLPGLKQPRAFLEPMQQVDVGSAYESLNKAIGQVSGQIRKVIQPIMNQQAEEAGARSVTRDENGVLQVGTRFEFEEQDQVYNNAAEAAYLSQLGLDMRSNFMELRTKENLQLDPEAFRVAAEGLLEGTLENAPSGMRGAVASLFNQELARNMTDIADKAERAMFQRQESAMKAGIEAQSNEVMRLASLNALDTPEGQQALQNYISAARQQENPIWGIAPEAVQQEIENTLSIAKGYAARGAVVGIYRKSGIEAAQAAARSILAAPDMNLTPAQRNALENDIMGEIGNMESLARARRAEAATYATAARAANDAALATKISDFNTFGNSDPETYQALRAEIDRAYASNAITPQDYQSNLLRLNSGMAEAANKAQKNEALVTGAVTRMTSGMGFNPSDSDQMKQLEAAFPLIAKDVKPEDMLTFGVQFARTYGAIPPQIVDMIKPGLYAAGDPERRVQAAQQLVALSNANRAAAEKQFGASEIEQALAIDEAMSGGVIPASQQQDPAAFAANVVRIVDDAVKLPADVKARNLANYKDGWKAPTKSSDAPGPYRQAALDAIAKMGIDVAEMQATNPAKLEQALRDAQWWGEKSMGVYASEAAAQNQATTVLSSKWGPTMWGRPTGETSFWSLDPRAGIDPAGPVSLYQPEGLSLGHMPPEVIYGAGLPTEQAFAYQALELTAVMLGKQIDPKQYDLKSWGEVGRITPEEIGTVGPDGLVKYQLRAPNGKLVLDTDGTPMIWQPDVKAGQAYAERLKAEAEDLNRRAQKANREADKLKEPELPGTAGIMQGGRN